MTKFTAPCCLRKGMRKTEKKLKGRFFRNFNIKFYITHFRCQKASGTHIFNIVCDVEMPFLGKRGKSPFWHHFWHCLTLFYVVVNCARITLWWVWRFTLRRMWNNRIMFNVFDRTLGIRSRFRKQLF